MGTFSFAVYAFFNMGPAAVQERLTRSMLRMEAWLLRAIDYAKSFANASQKSNYMQPTTVHVSVRLVNGEEVFLDHEFPVQDYIITIQDQVETLLKAPKCQLLQEGEVLVESQRIC